MTLLLTCFVAILSISTDRATAITWPVQLEDTAPGIIVPSQTGGVSVINCASRPNYTSQYHYAFYPDLEAGQAVSNRLLMDYEGSWAYFPRLTHCADWPEWYTPRSFVAASNGTLYAGVTRQDLSVAMVTRKNDRELRDPTVLNYCTFMGDEAGSVQKLVRGADGDLYGVLTSSRFCSDMVFGVSAVDGTIKFSHVLSLPRQGTETIANVWSYDDGTYSGLVAVTDQGTVRYFDYDGTEDTANAYSFPVPSGAVTLHYYANVTGRVYAKLYPNYPCTSTLAQDVLFHDKDGTNGGNQASTDWCTTSAGFADQNRVVVMPGNETVTFGDNQLVYHDQFGQETDRLTIPFDKYLPFGYYVDTNGSQVFAHDLYVDGETHVVVDEIDANNNVQRIFTTQDIETEVQNPTFKAMAFSDTIVDGKLYVAICHETCTTQNKAYLHKISIPNFGDEYIADGNAPEPPSTKLKYVALGDSYSSGEGVTPFTSASDIDGVNEYHRSEKSYPFLLEEETSLNLDLNAFVACSGATIDNIVTVGQFGEPKQLNALSDNTKVVTITIGGNDIGFKAFASACVLSDCYIGSPIYNAAR